MTASRTLGRAAAGALALAPLAAVPAAAHAFGQRYDLPVPFTLYVAGAGAAVALSFVVMALFVRAVPSGGGYPRIDLLRWRPGRALAHSAVVAAVRALAVAAFALVVAAGLIGAQDPFKNIAPIMVWVIWWIGMAYVCALVGDAWTLVNPLAAIAAWAGRLGRRAGYRRGGPPFGYPQWLGVWPSVAIFLVFAWCELVWDGAERPRTLSLMLLGYAAVTWAGMALFGREAWLRRAEAFSVVFGLLARFAPLEVRVTDPAVCAGCRARTCGGGDCVNCYDCYARAPAAARQWNLRPFAVGLAAARPVHASMMAFVVLVLATVSFDGFRETPAWNRILDALAMAPAPRAALRALQGAGIDALAAVETLGLVVAPVAFLAAYALFSRLTALAGGRGGEVAAVARLFVLSLVPIAIAYHLAHYLSFLMLAGQLVIPLASDPFGYGWNLFGTVAYRMDLSVVDARMVWYTAVAAIVAGHIVAVYVAHVVAVRAFATARLAVRSQVPMLVLMVGYTMISLWILAQPVVEDATLF